jgi:hypothetical protein
VSVEDIEEAQKEADREARLREVASKLFFTLKNQGLRGLRFSLKPPQKKTALRPIDKGAIITGE